jgi:hypothetical protein
MEEPHFFHRSAQEKFLPQDSQRRQLAEDEVPPYAERQNQRTAQKAVPTRNREQRLAGSRLQN